MKEREHFGSGRRQRDCRQHCYLLGAENYRVFKAYDGLEALEVLAENPIHLMILDVMMPRLNGIKTLMQLRQSRNIPVILLSAKSEDGDKILGWRRGRMTM